VGVKVEDSRWLLGVISAQPEKSVFGRIRLQKLMRLLQRRGLPSTYRFVDYHYGPYSQALQSDIGVLELVGEIREERRETGDGNGYFVITATPDFQMSEIDPYRKDIEILRKEESGVLELAATYDFFRELGSSHEESLELLKKKKPEKSTPEALSAALALLGKLELPHS
jgi:uncharacterized protein YwgA